MVLSQWISSVVLSVDRHELLWPSKDTYFQSRRLELLITNYISFRAAIRENCGIELQVKLAILHGIK